MINFLTEDIDNPYDSFDSNMDVSENVEAGFAEAWLERFKQSNVEALGPALNRMGTMQRLGGGFSYNDFLRHAPGVPRYEDEVGYVDKYSDEGFNPYLDEEEWDNLGFNEAGIKYQPGIRLAQAEYMARLKEEEEIRKDVIRREPGGVVNWLGLLTADFAGQMADPFTDVVSLIPFSQGLRLPAFMAKSAFASKVALGGPMRKIATTGAIDGMLGNAAVEGFVWQQLKNEQADMTSYDPWMNIAFGGILGAGLPLSVRGVTKLVTPVGDRLFNQPFTDLQLTTKAMLDMRDNQGVNIKPVTDNMSRKTTYDFDIDDYVDDLYELGFNEKEVSVMSPNMVRDILNSRVQRKLFPEDYFNTAIKEVTNRRLNVLKNYYGDEFKEVYAKKLSPLELQTEAGLINEPVKLENINTAKWYRGKNTVEPKRRKHNLETGGNPIGRYYTSDWRYAAGFGDVEEYKLNLRNVLDLRNKDNVDNIIDFYKKSKDKDVLKVIKNYEKITKESDGDFEIRLWHFLELLQEATNGKFTKKLVNDGYDGLIYRKHSTIKGVDKYYGKDVDADTLVELLDKPTATKITGKHRISKVTESVVKSLDRLGYSSKQISNMNKLQMWDIIKNETPQHKLPEGILDQKIDDVEDSVELSRARTEDPILEDKIEEKLTDTERLDDVQKELLNETDGDAAGIESLAGLAATIDELEKRGAIKGHEAAAIRENFNKILNETTNKVESIKKLYLCMI